MSTLSDHTIELMEMVKLSTITQKAREHTAMLRDLNKFLDSEASTSTQARRLVMGTRGYVGSITMRQVSISHYREVFMYILTKNREP